MTGHTGAPSGWHRVVTRPQMVVVALLVLTVWLALMAMGAWLFWRHAEVQLALRDQPLTLTLPAGLQAAAKVNRPLSSRLKASPRVPLEVDQRVRVRFEDALSARVALKTVLPVHTVVQVDQQVRVSAPVLLDVPVVRWLPPFKVTVPVQLVLPVQFEVPVDTQVPLDLDVLVSGRWPEDLIVPLKASWSLRPELDAPLRAALTRETLFTLQGPVAPLALRIPAMDLRMPVSWMALVAAPPPLTR